jgi:diguanylate cyclase (GGDEF)-like protein/PAS domain S-box-containing protein
VTRQGSLLLVDDNEANRDALSRRLQQRGYFVTVAPDGRGGLALAATGNYDLLLLDVEMPEMSGLEVLGRVRAERSDTELPVIMVTARTQGPDIVEAFRLGANDYITKPVDFPVTLARIATHLSRKWAVEDLRISEQRYALAVRGANDGLWDWNLDTNEVYWAPRWKAMLGYAEPEIGSSANEWFDRLHPADVERVKAQLTAHLGDGSDHFESEHRLMHRNGTFRWVHCRGAAVRNSAGVATRLAGSFSDITDAKLVDPLTGLPNRLLFVDLLERAIRRTGRRKDSTFALLVLALDRFTAVHDGLGPIVADQFLVDVARRLQSSLRSTDVLMRHDAAVTLARLGGDEFNVLLEDIADAGNAIHIAERLRRALQEPFEVDGRQVFTSCAVGIAVSTTGYEQADEVLRDASAALRRAKANDVTACEIFDPAMRTHAVSRLQLETDLRNAVEARTLEVHYQPIVSLQTGQITAVEALARWHHPARGFVSPGEFIGIAETTGLIRDIGRLTLAESCRQMASWQKEFGAMAPRVVCVNVSSRQFSDAGLMNEIEAVLKETGLPASSLKLEITESAFIDDVPAAQVILNRAQAIGIEWSLDDFGTGYSSLSHLHRLQVDTVKVDRSFVSRVGHEAGGLEMVQAIVTLAHNLGMDVVAEGVETAEQSAQLLALGCEYAQGFYFSKAVETLEVNRLILAQPWQHAERAPHVVGAAAGA